MGFLRNFKIGAALERELQRRNVKLVRADNTGQPRRYVLYNRNAGLPIHASQPDTTHVSVSWVDSQPPGYYLFDPPPFENENIGPYGGPSIAALVYLTMLDHVTQGGLELPDIEGSVCKQVGFNRDQLFGY